MTLSRRSKSKLVPILASLMHSNLSVLAYELGLDERAVGSNLTDRSLSLIRAIEESENSDKILLEIAESRLKDLAWQSGPDYPNQQLIRSLETDGYSYIDGKLLPTGSAAISMAPEVSALEQSLENAKFRTSVTHYRQAVDNYVLGNDEAANGALRSAIENFFIVLCADITGQSFTDAKGALQHLRSKSWLDDGEWNHFRSFWSDIQDNGPHHGMSSHFEALFRLHVGTAILRYAMAKRNGAA